MKTKNAAAVALGKLSGQVRSEAKREASRENGKLGGRPKIRRCVRCAHVLRASNPDPTCRTIAACERRAAARKV